MRKVVISTLVVFLVLVAAAPGYGEEGVGGGDSNLDAWSIDGALFARHSAGIRGIDIPAACKAHYDEWAAMHQAQYAGAEEAAAMVHDARVAANEAAVAAGEDPPYPDLPPVGTTTRDAFIAAQIAALGFAPTLQQQLEEEWVPIVVTDDAVPCTGDGILPAPPGGFVGIDLGDDDPPEADPCPPAGAVPFSPALWTWVPWWHENAPDPVNGGIYKVYDYAEGTLIFEFIPIVLGFELPQECVMLFPDDFASREFVELLPAASLEVLPDGPGFTGLETLLWYQLDDPGQYQAGPITISVSVAGAEATLTGWAWIDAVGWDMDFDPDGAEVATWDLSVDFPDGVWHPATGAEYATLGGAPEAPAKEWLYETKDYYTIATGVSWRGFYQITAIGGVSWNYTEPYDPVTTWETTDYRVDEIVGRVGG